MFRFEYSNYLYYLALIPVLLVWFFWARYQLRKALLNFADSPVLGKLQLRNSKTRPILKFLLALIALALIILAIARPQSGSKLREVQREGVEIIVALDVSNSMMAEDIKPNRLRKAKLSIEGLVDRLKGDKFGLIVFAGDAFTQIPLTSDYSAAKMFLESINPSVVEKQGTAIGKAIELGVKSFSQSETSKALIIISDGENHEDNGIDAAAAAAEKGIVVHTVGMGLPEGTPIPEGNDFKRDRDGNVVVTKLNEEMLSQIAASGKGAYIRANNTQMSLNTLFDQINKMEKTDFGTQVFSDYDDKFPYFAGFALLLLVLDLLLLSRSNKYFSSESLFGTSKKEN